MAERDRAVISQFDASLPLGAAAASAALVPASVLRIDPGSTVTDPSTGRPVIGP